MKELPRVYAVRAEFGRFSHAFITGNYIGIGWFGQTDLSEIRDMGKDALGILHDQYEPDASPNRKGQNIGQIWRFLEEITLGTYVITPSEKREILRIGLVEGEYYYSPNSNDSPYAHRKPIRWLDQTILRSELSVPLQNTLGSSLTVFRVNQVEEVLSKLSIGVIPQAKPLPTREDASQRVIDRLLELSADDFEILIEQVLAAIGFETRHVGRVGDGGIDVEGIMEM